MSESLSVAFTLAALVGLIAIGWAAVRHLRGLRGAAPGDADLRLLRSRALGQRTRLLVIGYRDREYVLGVSADRIDVIDRLPAAAPDPGEVPDDAHRPEP